MESVLYFHVFIYGWPQLTLHASTIYMHCPFQDSRWRDDTVVAVTSQEPGQGCERVTPGGHCDNALWANHLKG